MTLWLVVFSSSSQVMIIAPILPDISQELGFPLSWLGLLVASYAAAVGVFALLTGPVSDRLGRRPVLLAGSLLMTAALCLHLLAGSFASLLILRALAGAAGGILSGAAVAFVGDYFPSNRRGWANAWIMSGVAGGQMAGIPLGTLLSEHFGFRSPFLVFAVTMAFATALVWWTIPQLQTPASSDKLTLGSALAGYRSLLNRSSVRAAVLAYLLMFLGISLYMIYLPAWLETSFSFAAASIAALFLVGGIANVLAGPRAGRFSDTQGRRPVILSASLGITLLMAATPLVAVWSWSIYGLFFFIMGLFASRASPFQSLLTELVSGEQRGSLMGLTMATGQLGFGVGGALAGVVYVHLGFITNSLLGALTALLAAGLVWRYLPETLSAGSPTVPVQPDACNILGAPDALCGPCPEAGHMARSLQEVCAEKAKLQA